MKEPIKAKALKNFMYNLKKIKVGEVFECDYVFFQHMYNIPTNDPMIDYFKEEVQEHKEETKKIKEEVKEVKQIKTRKTNK